MRARCGQVGHHAHLRTGGTQVHLEQGGAGDKGRHGQHTHTVQVGHAAQGLRGRGRRGLQGELDHKFGAGVRCAGHGDASIHHLHQPLCDGQPQTGAAKFACRRGVGLGEGLKQLGHHRFAHANTVVGDGKLHAGHPVRARHGLHMQHDPSHALGDEFDRIAQQVEQDLAQAGGVRVNPGGQRGVDKQRDLRLLGPGHVQHQLRHAFHCIAQVGGDAFHFQLAGLDFGQIQNVVEDAQQGQRRVVDGVEHAPLRGIQLGLLEDVDHAHHAIHGRANLMAHVGQKFRFAAVGRIGGLFRQFQAHQGALGEFNTGLQVGGFLCDQFFQAGAVVVEFGISLRGGGDVPAHPHHAQGVALGVAGDIGIGFQVANMAIRVHHSEFGVKAGGPCHGVLHIDQLRFHVVRVHTGLPGINGTRKPFPRQPI